MTASTPKKNIVVLGASYTGFQAVESLVSKMHTTHRVVLVEKNSHAQHLFAFPRVSVVPGHERMVFIPFTTAFDRHPADSVAVVRGSATEILPDRVVLDKGDPIPYEFLVLATGTKLPPPGTLPSQDKMSGMRYLQQLQNRVAAAKNLVIVGGGAVGVQLATDIKDYYPTKNVTLVHSRDRLMHKFSPKMHEILMARMSELKVNVVLADRAKIPQNGFPTDGTAFEVTLQSGRRLQADFAILSTGQVPLSNPIKSLSPSSISPSGFVSVKRTLQITDDRYPNVFAIGDVADTPNQKTARLGMHHAEVMAENILSLARGRQPTSEYEDRGMGIHMSLGMTRDFKFRDPTPGEEPMVLLSDTGSVDMKLIRIWEHWAPGLTDYDL